MAAQSKTYGHLAVHYRKPEEGPLAARLLRELGFTECYSMAQPDGNTFYHFVIDETADRGTDRILYLLCMPEVIRSVYREIGERLGLGTADEAAAVTALREAQAGDPEFGFHAGDSVHRAGDADGRHHRRGEPHSQGRDWSTGRSVPRYVAGRAAQRRERRAERAMSPRAS